MNDLWYEGYASALNGWDWVRTVDGRYLTQWERKSLYDGYRTGVRDKTEWVADMVSAPVDMSEVPY